MKESLRITENGILLVNKPEGMSSAALVARIKRLACAQKAGHAGTLDPFAGGLMVLCINKATRLSRFFLHGDKSYTATVTYGRKTDTQDITGLETGTCDPVFFEKNPDFFSRSFQESLIGLFKGPQEQLPPVYSALKHNGVPLYKLARKGTPVQKKARSITIYDISLLSVDPPDVRLSVSCSGGTYIRTLASDLGEKAGCGAVLSALTRTGSCGFTIDSAVDLDTLYQDGDVAGRLIPMDLALPDMVCVDAKEGLRKKISHGMNLTSADVPVHQGFVKVRNETGALIAVLEWDNQGERYNYCCVFPD